MKYLFIILIVYSNRGFILSNVTKEKNIIKKVHKNKEINFPKRYLNENDSSIIYKRFDNKDANLQIIKFYNYYKVKNTISFNIYLYFFEYKIPNQIKFNILVSFEIRKKRSNEKIKIPSPESVETICNIIFINEYLVGEIGEGNITNYECKATLITDMYRIKIKNISMNTSIPMDVFYNDTEEKNATIDFNNINFNGNSSEESENIQDADELNNMFELTDANVVENEESYLIINGTLKLSTYTILIEYEIFELFILNNEKGNKYFKTYYCYINIISKKNNLVELECNAQYNPINTTIKDLHLSTGIFPENNMIIIKMKDWNKTEPIEILLYNEKSVLYAYYPSIDINVNAPISVEPKKNNSKDEYIQIMKFYNYRTDKINKKILFQVYFYFNLEKITKGIILRLRIKYISNNQKRRLDIAESVRCDCNINNKNFINERGNESIVDYTCEATTEKDINNIKNVSINTDIAMIIFDEYDYFKRIGFISINFNGNSSKESENLHQISKVNKKVELTNSKIVLISKEYFVIQGSFEPDNIIKNEELFKMTFMNKTNETYNLQKYDCMAFIDSDKSLANKIKCDTNQKPINTSIKDLYLSTGISPKNSNLLIIKMQDWKYNDKIIDSLAPIPTRKYFKDSGGLSGGAIAGIIIACSVVIILIIIFIIVFKKSPPTPVKINNNSSINKFESSDKL